MKRGISLCVVVAGVVAAAGAWAAPFVCVLPGPDGDPALSPGALAVAESLLRRDPALAMANRRQAQWVLAQVGVAAGRPPTGAQAEQACDRIGCSAAVLVSLRADGADYTARASVLVAGQAAAEEVGPAAHASDPVAAIAQAIASGAETLLEGAGSAGTLAALPSVTSEAFASFCEGCRLDGDPATQQEARAAFERAIELSPGFTLARKELGALLLDLGLWEEAAAQYRTALEQEPNSGVLLTNLGRALAEMDDTAGAESVLRQAIGLGRDSMASAYAYNNLGVAYLRAKRYEEALTAFERARRMLPRYAMAHANVARTYMLQDQFGRAADAAQRAVEFANDRWALSYAHRLLGDIALRQNDLVAAVGHYHEAVAVRPEYAMVYNNLGVALKRQGNIAGAEEAFSKAIALDNDHTAAAYAHTNRGNLCRDRGDRERAIAEYEAALRLKPDYAAASDALRKLRGGE
ncbi:MAG TPA: tetratricopeptide repeat protein [Armatimonadota bacterium]|nr:tetratricopeptide repeat protein [Armatimonadota bacterium]